MKWKRKCGHGGKQKTRIYPKKRKAKVKDIPNPRTNNPLYLEFDIERVMRQSSPPITSDMVNVESSNEEIQKETNLYLDVIPDYLTFGVDRKYLYKKDMKVFSCQ